MNTRVSISLYTEMYMRPMIHMIKLYDVERPVMQAYTEMVAGHFTETRDPTYYG